jgi:hypothetical protein
MTLTPLSWSASFEEAPQSLPQLTNSPKLNQHRARFICSRSQLLFGSSFDLRDHPTA